VLTHKKPNLVIRINHEKCAVLLRNFQLVEAVKDRIGGTTSQIYAELLKQLEKKIDKCQYPKKEDDTTVDSPSVMTNDIASSLSKSINVALGIGKTTSGANKTGELGRVMGSPESSKKRKVEDFEAKVEANDEDVSMVNGTVPEVEDDPFADAPAVKPPKRQKVTFEEKLPRVDDFYTKDDRVLHVKDHMLLLENDQYGFVKKAGMGGHGEWAINFPKIVEHLKELEIDKLVFEMFGQTGRRLVRMLRKLGKLDEKTLKEGALMKQKDVRTKLAELQLAGWIDIQEIPKDASRGTNNARCIFLWFFDNERSSTLVLDHTYKAMSRLLQRLDVERRRAKSVLELIERSDVRDKPPEEYLIPVQLNELESFREKEDMLLGQLGRLDEIVGIFKDY
jgi:DNA-directed RNA polymerase III subunit RPC3